MQDLMKTMGKFGFVALAILIVGWTGYHTYDLLWKTNPVQDQMFLAVYGLLVFEAGTLIWFLAFLKNAEGLGQHAIALFGTIIGALLVITAFVLDYTIPPERIAAYDSVARWTVIVATIVNFVFVLLYELFNPTIWEELQENVHVAVLYAKAEVKARQQIEADSESLAEEIAGNRKARAYARARLGGIKEIPTQAKPKPLAPQVAVFAADAIPPGAVIKPAPEVPDAMTFIPKDRARVGDDGNGTDPNAQTPR